MTDITKRRNSVNDELKAPFPWFGGKRKVAPQVWDGLGDVANYVEPFAGSLAVLLGRPNTHTGTIETVNDLDQYIANFWRAVAHDPDQVAHYADWPVNETDLFSRHLWLVNEGRDRMQAGMAVDPNWYDAKIAGWWVWGICSWIGRGWCSGTGPYTYETIAAESLPIDGHAGRGVNRQLPYLGRAGQGVNRQLPHLGHAGRGVTTKKRRESLVAYMQALANRLRHVRVCCGDWTRVVTKATLSYGTSVGVFLDPPYSAQAARTNSLYRVDDLSVAHAVREWCIANGDNPRYRIALCGYDNEHAMPDGWRMFRWRRNGGYANKGNGTKKINRAREVVWFSPHCVQPRPTLLDND